MKSEKNEEGKISHIHLLMLIHKYSMKCIYLSWTIWRSVEDNKSAHKKQEQQLTMMNLKNWLLDSGDLKMIL